MSIQVRTRDTAGSVAERRGVAPAPTQPLISDFVMGRLVMAAQIALGAAGVDAAQDALEDMVSKRFAGKSLADLTVTEAGRVEAGLLETIERTRMTEAPFSYNTFVSLPIPHPETGTDIHFTGQITVRALTGTQLRANIGAELGAILAAGGGPDVRPGGRVGSPFAKGGAAPAQAQAEEVAPKCDKCGQTMVQKNRRDGSGWWWACQTKYGSDWCGGKPRK